LPLKEEPVHRRIVAYVSPLHFDDSSVLGGGERILINWARAVVAASRGAYRVEIVSFGAKPGRRELDPGVGLRLLAPDHRPDHPCNNVSWGLPEAIADADLVHVHQIFTYCGESAILAAKIQRKAICATDHGGNSSFLGRAFGLLELVDLLLPLSDFAASKLATNRPTVVIRGGIDTEFFSPPTRRVPRDRVLFVGRLLPHKGIDRLIAALPPELPLTVYGQPWREDYLRHLQDLARGKKVDFAFKRQAQNGDEAMRDLHRRAWVKVLPSVYRDCYGNRHDEPEHLGLSLLEAMACGTPAICNRVGGMPECIKPGETGYVYDSPDELTAMLRKLSSEPGLADAMGDRAREVAVAEFGLEAIGAKLIAAYESALSLRANAA
jgi:glycosyltransferase involved in cell wall biosynthesis